MARVSDMTLALFVEDFPPTLRGGGGRSNGILASAIAARVSRVYVLGSSASGPVAGIATPTGHLPSPGLGVAAMRDATVIHVCGRVDPGPIRALQLICRAPVVYTSRSNARAIDRLSMRPSDSWRNHKQDALLELSAAVVACSRPAAAELMLDYPQHKKKIHAIENALDPALLTAMAVEPASAPKGRPVLGFLGRMRRHKGLPDLLAASELLWQRGLEFELKVVAGHAHSGEGDMAAALDGLRQRWPQFVHRCEWSDDVRVIAMAYKAAHCIVVPSIIEPFGLVAIEALAAGCYLIASDAGGLTDTVAGVGCASSYPRGDVSALADRISQFVLSRCWETMQTDVCAASVRRRYDTNRMAAAYLDLYNGLRR